jgi:hypothetical protein
MSSAPTPTDLHREQMILRAERRREMLERISAVGTKAAERLGHRAWAQEVGDEAARNGLAFAKVSRAVRLTLMLEGKIDEDILALHNGLTPVAVGWLEPGNGSERRPLSGPVGSKDVSAQDHEASERREVEVFAEREFDRLPSGGFKVCVAAICDDLGLSTDCSLDDTGVPPPSRGGARKNWRRLWVYPRTSVDAHRRWRAQGAADGLGAGGDAAKMAPRDALAP